jgi:hypothetical protein
MKPRNPKMTHIKGYMKDPANIQYDERVEITRGLNAKDQSYASIVLNLNKKTVVKNTFKDDRDFDTMFKYFLEAYPQYMIELMKKLDAEYLEQFLPKEPDVVDVEVKETAPE